MSKIKLELQLDGAQLVASDLGSEDLVKVTPLFEQLIESKLGKEVPKLQVGRSRGVADELFNVVRAASKAVEEHDKKPVEVVSPEEMRRLVNKTIQGDVELPPIKRRSTVQFDLEDMKGPTGKLAVNESKSNGPKPTGKIPSDEVLAKYGYKVRGHEEKKVVASSEDKTKSDTKSTKKLKQTAKFDDYSTTKLVAIKCEGCGDTIIKRVENDECEVYCAKCKTHNDINPLEKYPSAYYHCDCGAEMNIDEVINFKDTSELVKSKCRRCKQELSAMYNKKDNTYYRY